VDQSSDRVGIEAALVEPAAHQKARRGAHAQTDAFLITCLDSPGVFPRRHASVIAGEVEAVLLGIAPEDPGRIPRGGPFRLALVDPLMLSPVLPLLVRAGCRMGRQPREAMLLQGKVAVPPAEPDGVDQPL